MTQWTLDPGRYFDPNPAQREAARSLYADIVSLPIVSPHGHVDPRLLSDPDATFGAPTELLIIPDHYIFRMLYSQGIPLVSLGVPARDGSVIEQDHRAIWQRFAEHFYLFRGTPSGGWLAHALVEVFGIRQKLSGDTAQAIYDELAAKLDAPEYRPRALFERFNIEVLCTTDAATDDLHHHQAIRDSGWGGQVLPTFRPDAVVNLETPGWRDHIARLSEVSGIDVVDYTSFIAALEQRREIFKAMGARATDHAALTAYTAGLSGVEAGAIFARALRGQATAEDAVRFTGHMLIEMARMSIEDGLVMQLHVGSYRNYNPQVFARFGADKGCDIPVTSEFTQNLHPLLAKYGNDARLSLILFTLDESTFSRELAPLAGHYPSLILGPPWWFHDSPNGMARYFDRVMETAGLYNTAGFNDDTRAFPSIPARHDVWRRCACDWVAGLWVRGRIDEEDARAMAYELAYGLAKRAYRLDRA
ncbi:MAG: glucuronate isomerase [Anaerolineae bacterium]|nr:glucuronate isomerase [Anaerolineae bacterium]